MVCVVNESCCREPTDLTKLYFFYGPNYFDHKIYNYNELEEIVKDVKYNASRLTTLYMHGYAESMGSDSVHRIVNAYLLRKEHNIIALDWNDAASGNYFINAVPNAITVIDICGEFLLSIEVHKMVSINFSLAIKWQQLYQVHLKMVWIVKDSMSLVIHLVLSWLVLWDERSFHNQINHKRSKGSQIESVFLIVID